MPRAEDLITCAAVGLGRGLRDAGLRTTVDAELVFCRALAELDLRSRGQVYWAGRAAFVRCPEEIGPFDAVFDRFWRGLEPTAGGVRAEHGESDPRMPGPQHGGESLPEFRSDGRSSELLDGQPNRATRDIPGAGGEEDDRRGPRERRGVLAAYSPDEVVGDREELCYQQAELAAVRRLADELRAAAPLRRSRRLRPTRRGGRPDVRRTLQRALRTEGEALRLARMAPARKPRRLLVLCDVSGSMERHSRALLATLEAVVSSGLKAETFVFATRLTRVTAALASHDLARALADARARVDDWSGGTRIGEVLTEFNATHGRRGLARGAIAIVVSDGWDRGDPQLLASELQRLRLQCRRLIWINPRPLEAAAQPLAVGLRAALPIVDDYVPGADPALIAHVLQVAGPARPARRQRPVGSAR
jgi:uncharacterized protein with von Willebrand factor type A (vWA) domain